MISPIGEKSEFPHQLLPLVVAFLTTPEGRGDPKAAEAWGAFHKAADRVIHEVVAEQSRRRRIDTNDSYQAAALRLILALPGYRHDERIGKLSGWIAEVTRRAIIENKRRESRLERVRRPTLSMKRGYGQPMDHGGVEEFDRREHVEVLLERIRKRFPQDHQVIVESFFNSKSPGTVPGESTTAKSAASRKKLQRALERIRVQLTQDEAGSEVEKNRKNSRHA